MKWFNGRLYFASADEPGDTIYWHYARVASSRSLTKDSIASAMAKSAIHFLMRSIPGKMEKGKWTKNPNAVDWFMVALLPARLMKFFIHEAWKHKQTTNKNKTCEGVLFCSYPFFDMFRI